MMATVDPRADSVPGRAYETLWILRGVMALQLFLLFLFPFSILFVAFDLLPSSWNWTASAVIFLQMALMVLSEARAGGGLSLILLSLFVGTAAMVVEALGVRTGFPFGSYDYTDVLGLKIGGVPLAMSAAWVVSMLASHRLGATLRLPAGRGILPLALAGAIFALCLDLVLEPAAAFERGYWTWREGAVPLRNYAAWFSLGLFFNVVIAITRRNVAPVPGLAVQASLVYGMQWFLFAITGIVAGRIFETVVSAAVIAGLLLLHRTGRKRHAR